MGQLGYHAVFVFCGFLALPGGIACYLAGAAAGGGGEGNCGACSCESSPPYVEAIQHESSTDSFSEGIELVEGEATGDGKGEAEAGGGRVTHENACHSLRPLTSHPDNTEKERYAGFLPAHAAFRRVNPSCYNSHHPFMRCYAKPDMPWI